MLIYPPRPANAIGPDFFQFYANLGYVGQIKKNGTCSVAVIDKQGNTTFKTRHVTKGENEDHKAWSPPEWLTYYFQNMLWHDSILVFELLHNKHESVKNTLYIFDILRHGGKDLVGMKLMNRLALLQRLKTHAQPNANIKYVETFENDNPTFLERFNNLSDPIDEGIVLKNPSAPLERWSREKANTSWQVKVRKPHKNFGF